MPASPRPRGAALESFAKSCIRFSPRGSAGATSRCQTLAPEEIHRQVLGLPLDRRLSAPEIHRAWKRAAKSAHPDAGGSVQAFQALSAARDALIKQR